jgi:hypothetical protein
VLEIPDQPSIGAVGGPVCGRKQLHASADGSRWPDKTKCAGTRKAVFLKISNGASENDGNVVGLFGLTNPIRHGIGDGRSDIRERVVEAVLD